MKAKLKNTLTHLYNESKSSVIGQSTPADVVDFLLRLYDMDVNDFGLDPIDVYEAMVNDLMHSLYVNSGYPGASEYTFRPGDLKMVDPLHKLEVTLPNVAKNPAVVEAIKSGSADYFDVVDHFGNNNGSMADFSNKFPSTGGSNSDLPDIDVDLYGLSDHDINFIISLYIGAFDRAPEHGGLDYWARELSEKLASGRDHTASLLDISKEFYAGGTVNGEKGTNLSTAEFITSIYNGLLGREPDADGMAYWTSKLEHEGLIRADFLVPFVHGALQAQGDSDVLLRKIAVAKVVAQEHVTGENIDGSLLLAVGSIDSDEAAWSILNEVYDTYGYGALPAQRSMDIFSAEPDSLDTFGRLDAQESFDAFISDYSVDAFSTDVELVGGIDESSSSLPDFAYL